MIAKRTTRVTAVEKMRCACCRTDSTQLSQVLCLREKYLTIFDPVAKFAGKFVLPVGQPSWHKTSLPAR